VAYIDRCGMISSFEKIGPFMSTWVMGDYRKRGDLFPQLLREKQPRFLLVNSPTLDLRRPFARVKGPYRWRRGDYEQLRENFVHHWGPIWLVGKSLVAEPGKPVELEIFVPGHYKVEAKGPVEIDGRVHQPGAEIDLATGMHTLIAADRESQSVILRWGPSLPRPTRRPVDEVKFRGFGLRAPPR
jgi:hypothetical protein